MLYAGFEKLERMRIARGAMVRQRYRLEKKQVELDEKVLTLTDMTANAGRELENTLQDILQLREARSDTIKTIHIKEFEIRLLKAIRYCNYL